MSNRIVIVPNGISVDDARADVGPASELAGCSNALDLGTPCEWQYAAPKEEELMPAATALVLASVGGLGIIGILVVIILVIVIFRLL